jgi:predicted RNA-binding Zn-ribbon protein involved in translation (DUF1610 family)
MNVHACEPWSFGIEACLFAPDSEQGCFGPVVKETLVSHRGRDSTMSINVPCTNCGKSLKAKEELAGKRVKCPSCGQVITVSASCPPSPAEEKTALPGPDSSPPKPDAASPPVQENRRVRWPLFAGLGAVAVCLLSGCLVSGVVFLFSVLGTKSAEDEVIDFLVTREVLQHSISGSRLTPDVIDWLALGVDEPLDQRLAIAQVLNFGDFLQDKSQFDGVYKDSVESGIRVGLIDCKAATKLLRENKDFAKNTLTRILHIPRFRFIVHNT